MNRVPLLLRQNPNLKYLNLEFSEIDSLENLLPWLCEFTELEELSLFGNCLEKLPEDLSKLLKLKKIDLNNNFFKSVDVIIPSLCTLPCLIDLQYNLNSPEEEDKVFASLPNLKKLNLREAWVENTHEITPIALSCKVDYTTEDITLKQQELEEIAVIYDDLRGLWREIEPRSDKKLAEHFDFNIKGIMTGLSEIHNQPISPHLLHCYTLKAKYSFFNICQEKAMQYVARSNKKLSMIFEEIHKAYADLFEESITMVFSLDKKYNSVIDSLQEQLDKANSQTAEVLEAAEKLEKECDKHVKDKNAIKTSYEEEKYEMTERLNEAIEENQRYLEALVKYSKNYAENVMASKKYSISQQAKNLTLRQTKEIIQEIYESKFKFDKKCIQEALPRETMEQHMYTFLNHKYGLKILIIEWAAGIISAIKKYAGEDNEVLVFAKILKNEIDEEFRFIQKKLKDTIVEFLKSKQLEKSKTKTLLQAEEKVKKKIRSYLKKSECEEIVNFFYGKKEFDELFGQVVLLVDGNERISYKAFEQLVLTYQQRTREQLVRGVVERFKLVDTDRDGVITLAEFKSLLSLLELTENYSQVLSGVTKLTLSDCILLFSKDLLLKAPINP